MDHLAPIFTNRLRFFVLIFGICFMALLYHFFNLQVMLNLNFFRLSRKNFLRYEKIASLRGNIIDSNGRLLATNRPFRSLHWQGTGQQKLTPEQEEIITQLEHSFSLPAGAKEMIAKAEKLSKKIPLAEDIPFEQFSRIIEQFPHHKNICITHHFKRHYPFKTVASHIIGYLGNIGTESTGLMGLEMLFQEKLRGEVGQRVKTINSIGKNLAEEEVKRALSGGTIETTLDIDLQHIAEELFPEEESGAIIVLDPQTGAIRTLLSRPAFDPTMFLHEVNKQDWQALQDKKCFINRALNACYPPASLFKLVTLSAALDEGIITQDTSWYCIGHVNFANRPYHCNNQHGHGVINAEQALAYSCNTPFFNIATKIKIDTLAHYAQRLGLGSKTTNLLPEKAGLIPTSAWKLRVKNEPWWPGETLSAAIGQSFLLITPMQAACMISAICEGYLVRPRILTSEPIAKQTVAISQPTLQFLKNSLQHVIKKGTGRSLSRLKDIEIYAKTGTAQTSDLAKRSLGKKYEEHGWFVLYFRYKDNKPLTMAILIENISSSRVATSLGSQILMRYCTLMDERAKKDDQ